MVNRWIKDKEYAADEVLPALVESVQYWQTILRLQDWNIILKLVRRHDMGVQGAIGCSDYAIDHKDCFIELCAPEDLYTYHARFAGEETDYEITLVHELLHLHFAPFMADETKDAHSNTYQELAINTLARSLVHLDRKGALTPE